MSDIKLKINDNLHPKHKIRIKIKWVISNVNSKHKLTYILREK